MKRIKFSYERNDKRGIFREYLNSDSPWRSINQGVMKKNSILGNHYHKKTKSAFFILSGSASFIIKDIRKKNQAKKFVIKNGEGVLILPYETHAIKFLEKSTFLLAKSNKFNSKDKDLYEAKLEN